jgi:hypothetical protein
VVGRLLVELSGEHLRDVLHVDPARVLAAWQAVPAATRTRAEGIFADVPVKDVPEADGAFAFDQTRQVLTALNLPDDALVYVAMLIIGDTLLRHYEG